ncbi:ribbon-helix-helix domain-containing protein [Cellulomonas triticagri]|uniref:Ribbon-helix-helix protein, CopG family n=1 Tax=Cellulomonas triticagri TaxID=2483352 RepID=A0A3M2J3W7_9CELL|nr:ribbon-helix-helix domain-containing protein [Cellulomonas triticagri]RMI08777.1 ribbon-helix-helix protein, CopG family [Cellulomonas triticagri]
MSTQIAVRLPDDMVRAVDAFVASGRARSRASVVERALAREIRRFQAERDVEILRAGVPGDDLDALADWAAEQPVDGLD